MRVSVANSNRSFSVDPDQSMLDAALDAGLNVPHGCKGGNCGACRARLLTGTVHYPQGAPLGLSATDVGERLILLCRARAREDLCIETIEMSSPDHVTIQRLPARIEHMARWSHDVLGLFLRLPPAVSFRFLPGQYLDVLLSGGLRRSFSIASPPHDPGLLELHVRRVVGGAWTETLFAGSLRDTLLSIEGPLGRFVYREDSAAPMLLIGGGTGLAPLKSVLRHVIENGLDREMTLYWGVRDRRDLYAHDELSELAVRVDKFRYHAVLSEAGADWNGQRGWVHRAVLDDLRSLAGHDIYAAGPPAMIAAIREELPGRGADPGRLFLDSFDYAPDSGARQRTIAVNKS